MIDVPPPLPDDKRVELRKFLITQSTMALATVGDDGRPQVTPLFFVCDEVFNFFWISSPDSRHSVNLGDWNDVAATVYAHTWEYAAIKGIQVEGDAMPVTDEDERARALKLYTAKFPFVNEKFMPIIEQSIYYVLRPRWLRWIDNARRFGYKQEFSLQSAADSD